MSIAEYIDALKKYRGFAGDIVCHRTIPRRDPDFSPASVSNGLLGDICESHGITKLYTHQKEAIDLVMDGFHTVVATPTASGKSLVYNLPVIDRLMRSPGSRALYLFPLKALARDQLDTVTGFLKSAGDACSPRKEFTAAVYDGDLSSYKKGKIRNNPPDILLSNPDMLHLSILAHHHLWTDFFSSLRFVIIDEVHTYRGVMGSHMAWVFRRLRRICRHYGSDPQFIFCSATIGNPDGLASDLAGVDVRVVERSTAGSGRKDAVIMRGSDGAARTAVQLLHAALHRGLRTIVYTGSRKITELVAIWISGRAGKLADKVASYRAGFLPEERRDIEQKLSSGELLAVVSTSALELGIDIGTLDLCILVGYPGTIMSTWQRAGRVGRKGRDSAFIFVAHEDALDQYFVNNPDRIFEMPPEKAVINPANEIIMKQHLECAAADLSLHREEEMLTGDRVRSVLRTLETEGRLLRSGDGDFWYAARKNPHRAVTLRGTGRSIPIFIENSARPVGEIDRYRAFRETHEGAVYLHKKAAFLVTKFDWRNGSVEVKRKNTTYFTRVRASKSTLITRAIQFKDVWHTRAGFGKLRVTEEITGYEKKLVANGKSLGIVPLDLPPIEFDTEGVWIEIPPALQVDIEKDKMHFMGGIHALEHAAIGILPVLVMTDRNDLGGISIPFHPQTGGAAVFVYDGIPGGMGLARHAFEKITDLLDNTLNVIGSCECKFGCPACVHSPKCGSGNRPIDKQAALAILKRLKSNSPRKAGGLTGMQSHFFEPGAEAGVTEPSENNGSGAWTGGLPPPQAVPRPSVSMPAEESASEEKDKASCPAEAEGKTQVRYGVLDIETRLSAKEVGGWHRAEKMKMSCAVLYDSGTGRFNTYLMADLETLEKDLMQLDMVVGFNLIRFDYKVLSGISSFDFFGLNTLDMLQSVHEKLGYRLSLDRLASETLGVTKSADGLAALKWWKQGRIREIIDYCRQDVIVTRDLYLFGKEKGFLLFRNKAGKQVRLPVQW